MANGAGTTPTQDLPWLEFCGGEEPHERHAWTRNGFAFICNGTGNDESDPWSFGRVYTILRRAAGL